MLTWRITLKDRKVSPLFLKRLLNLSITYFSFQKGTNLKCLSECILYGMNVRNFYQIRKQRVIASSAKEMKDFYSNCKLRELLK